MGLSVDTDDEQSRPPASLSPTNALSPNSRFSRKGRGSGMTLARAKHAFYPPPGAAEDPSDLSAAGGSDDEMTATEMEHADLWAKWQVERGGVRSYADSTSHMRQRVQEVRQRSRSAGSTSRGSAEVLPMDDIVVLAANDPQLALRVHTLQSKVRRSSSPASANLRAKLSAQIAKNAALRRAHSRSTPHSPASTEVAAPAPDSDGNLANEVSSSDVDVF
jgi:hypothetical protein